jgi:hypothetical protein
MSLSLQTLLSPPRQPDQPQADRESDGDRPELTQIDPVVRGQHHCWGHGVQAVSFRFVGLPLAVEFVAVGHSTRFYAK